ncbi:MAG: DUF4012 domain-containing protein [Candidatus Nanopelagicales bacterium]
MRRFLLAIALLSVLGLAWIGWLAVTAKSALGQLESARSQLNSAQAALTNGDAATARGLFEQARASSGSARRTTHTLVWDAAAAVPGLGATPGAAQSVIAALDEALEGLAPAAEFLSGTPMSTLVSGGTVDVAALARAEPKLSTAAQGLRTAQETLSNSPRAGRVLGTRIEQAHQILSEQIGALEGRVAGLAQVAQLAPPLLGDDGRQDYFLALLNPNEARGGGGGFMGTFAVLRADSGHLTITDIAANEKLQSLKKLPAGFSADFQHRYGKDALDLGNLNMSPDFPSGARLWLSAYQQTFGRQLDGVVAVDVVAVGNLLTTLGESVSLPDGTVMNGAQLTQFAISGIYERFPTAEQAAERSLFQTEAMRGASEQLTSVQPADPAAFLRMLGEQVSARRVQMFSTDEQLQAQLAATPLGGALEFNASDNLTVAFINSSGNKLDAFLHPKVTLTVDRCTVGSGAESSVELQLTSVIPPNRVLPPFVISLAPLDATGPINVTTVQFHLPFGAVPEQLELDGQEQDYFGFTEAGRPALAVGVKLVPRVTHTLILHYASLGGGADLRLQPTALPGVAEVRTTGCS